MRLPTPASCPMLSSIPTRSKIVDDPPHVDVPLFLLQFMNDEHDASLMNSKISKSLNMSRTYNMRKVITKQLPTILIQFTR